MYENVIDEEARRYCNGEAQRVRAAIAERVGARTVLDVGCGPGTDAHRYSKRQYTGLDASQALVRAARHLNPGYLFMCGTAADLRANGLWAAPHEAYERLDTEPGRRGVPRPSCCILTAVLEHTATAKEAVELLADACAIARDVVFVAWRTPPAAEEKLWCGPRHFDRPMHQNQYRLDTFDKFKFTATQVDDFTLWEVGT